MADNAKRDALIAEGLSPAEADYMTSGGTKTDGLDLPAGSTADASGAAAAAPADPAATSAAPGTDAQADKGAAGGAAGAAAASGAAPAAGDDDGDPEPPKDSPFYQQWHREKRRRQALQTELRTREERLAAVESERNTLAQNWARLDERFKVFQEAATAPADPNAGKPAAPPDPETNPFGYMKWLGEQVTGLAGQTREVVDQTQAQQAASVLRDTFIGDAREYSRANPDFWESAPQARDGAYHFLMKSRDAELLAAGYTDPVERKRIISLDEQDIVARALHARQTNPQAPGPAEVLFNLATARGYQKRTAAAASGAAANGAGGAHATNGAANGTGGAGAPNGGSPSVTQQVEQIARGQAASRSLSSGGGAPVPQGIDLARLAAMDDNEYRDFVRNLTPIQRKEYHALIGAPKQ